MPSIVLFTHSLNNNQLPWKPWTNYAILDMQNNELNRILLAGCPSSEKMGKSEEIVSKCIRF